MGEVDIAIKHLSTLYPKEFIQEFIPEYRVRSSHLRLDKELLRVERRVDFIYEVITEDEERFIAHLEFQSEWEGDIPVRIFEYAGLISREYGLPLISILIYLGKGTYTEESYQIVIGGKEINRYDYKMIPLSGIEIREELYEKEGLLPLISLMKVEDPENIFSKVIDRIEKIEDKNRRLELQAIWYILSGIRYDKEFLDRFVRREALMES